jgi:hypothetical protein
VITSIGYLPQLASGAQAVPPSSISLFSGALRAHTEQI